VYKTIVAGTDGSETANAAVRQAIQLAKLSGAKVHLVSAFKAVPAIAMAAPDALSQLSTPVDSWDEQMTKEASAMLQQLSDEAKKEGVETELHVIEGDPAEVIIEVADDKKADLIVVGNRGMTGATRFLLGSVPNKITHHAPCSVLIAHTA
jgi:nucleotide-binding universal stress UspA family protein